MSTLKVNAIQDTGGHTLLGRKNLIINGGFDVWQRGTSFSISGSVPYTADRWKIGGGTSTTVSRQTFAVGQTDVPNNPTYYCRWDMTNNSQYYEFTQKIENVSTASGQSLTISYWAKRNSGSLNPQLQIVQDFGSGGSSTVVTAVATPSLTSSWTKYTYTVSVPSISGKTLGTGHCLYVRWQSLTTDTGQIDIANVQAEVGSVATPFEHRSFGEELVLCQRYYETSDGVIQTTAGSTGFGTNTYYNGITYAVTKRANATVTFKKNDGTASQCQMWIGATEYTGTNPVVELNNTNGFGGRFSSSVTDAGLLRFQWFADAEL